MLHFFPIENEKALAVFADGFATYTGVRLSISYLQQGRVFACRDDRGALVGGYALITRPKLRGLSFLPDQVKEDSEFLESVPESSMMEINALWLAKSFTSHRDWLAFYRQLI